jgi:predicted SprT family Zn-dependent metalloprotease
MNEKHFEGFLDPPILVWNTRLKITAGRFRPGRRRRFQTILPKIEVATYLLSRHDAEQRILETMGHEMIHYWLWVLGRPYGHTEEFCVKMREMGVPRYNPVPERREFKYLYACLHCKREYPTRKKMGPLACAACCKNFGGGKFDARFRIILKGEIPRV